MEDGRVFVAVFLPQCRQRLLQCCLCFALLASGGHIVYLQTNQESKVYDHLYLVRAHLRHTRSYLRLSPDNTCL